MEIRSSTSINKPFEIIHCIIRNIQFDVPYFSLDAAYLFNPVGICFSFHISGQSMDYTDIFRNTGKYYFIEKNKSVTSVASYNKIRYSQRFMFDFIINRHSAYFSIDLLNRT